MAGNVKVQKRFNIDICNLQFSDITIYAGETSTYDLPLIFKSSSTYIYEVGTSQITQFAAYFNCKFNLNPTVSQIGSYQVQVKQLDSITSQLVQSANFKVIVASAASNPSMGACPYSKKSQCQPYISGASLQGVVTMSFRFPMQTYSSKFYQNISDSLQLQLVQGKASLSNASIANWTVIAF